jgi:hypothetical protein
LFLAAAIVEQYYRFPLLTFTSEIKALMICKECIEENGPDESSYINCGTQLPLEKFPGENSKSAGIANGTAQDSENGSAISVSGTQCPVELAVAQCNHGVGKRFKCNVDWL